MAIKITEIKNLSNGTVVKSTESDKFDNQTQGAAKITAAGVVSEEWNKFNEKDNIQVTWTDDTTPNKPLARAVNGTYSISDDKTVTISGLQDASKYSIGINGQIAIGKPGATDAALVSISMGNIRSEANPKADTIINLSDKTYSDKGTQINLTALLAWIQGQDEGSEKPALPEAGDGTPSPIKPNDFMIEFKELYYNITQKTFDIDVHNSAGSEITFGAFTIKNVGLRITNTPIELPKKETKELAE
jgi:hypothetical protein